MKPEISVLMSTYNGDKTIDKAIKSILNQTYTNFEFIICNDCSTDNTNSHLLYWAHKDKRIHIFNNKRNLGLQRSLNECIDYSNGKYIARMDDDDISLNYRFAKQVQFLRLNPEITFVGSNVLLFDNKYGVFGENYFIQNPSAYQLFKNDEFCHPSIMIRSNVLKNVGGYSTKKEYYRIEDHELWLRLYYLGYKGANIKKPLLKYRMRLNSKNMFYDYFHRFLLLKYYKKKLHIGFKGYFYIVIPLIKLMVPSFFRNIIYKIKYKNR